MPLNRFSTPRRNPAISLVVALIASLIVLVGPSGLSHAVPLIVFNNGVCNLGDWDPSNHQSNATAFEISTPDELWEVTDCVSSSSIIYFKLANNIDVSASTTAPTRSPIGFGASGNPRSFSGVLDGQNKIISGISMSTTSYGVGLFAYLHNATISNLVISGSFVTTTTKTYDSAGGNSHASGALAIRAAGTLFLSSISNLASVAGYQSVGGLVGLASNSATIIGSNNSATISGHTHVAGFVGLVADEFTVSSSHNTGLISGSNNVGGFSGTVLGETTFIHSSNNAGMVHATNDDVGGCIGYVNGDAVITSSFNDATVSGSVVVGGLVGYVRYELTVSNSHNSGSIGGVDGVGGLVAQVGEGKAYFDSSFNSGRISALNGSVGGLIGYIQDDLRINSSHNSGQVIAQDDYAGGLAGWINFVNSRTYIDASFNSGRISGDDSIGGLVGEAGGRADITSSFNTGVISGSERVGGLFGGIRLTSIIHSSSNAGQIQGSNHTGGLVGVIYAASVDLHFSQNTGSVQGEEGVGGLIGTVEDGSATVESSFNTGAISASRGSVGGLIGENLEMDVTIRLSHNSGSVDGVESYVGGLVGYVRSVSEIEFSSNSGAIAGLNDAVGGLIGRTGVAFVAESQNTGRVSSPTSDAGGLIGFAQGASEIDHSFNLGDVFGFEHVGGLFGRANNRLVINSSFNEGEISGANLVGGLAGRALVAESRDSYNTGFIDGSYQIGGLFGWVDELATLTSSRNLGPIAGIGQVGGLVGWAVESSINTSHNSGQVSASDYVGGLIGHVASASTISMSFNEGQIFANGSDGEMGVAGGLVGLVEGSINISASFNAGNVTTPYIGAGGLIGFARANPTYFGGNFGIAYSYNVGSVSGGSYVDGLVGAVEGIVTANFTYTSVASSFSTTSSVDNMKKATTYVGFDFENLWGFGLCTFNSGYPLLRAFAQVGTYYSVGCYAPPAPTSTTVRSYAGPLVETAKAGRVGSDITFTGTRLYLVTSAFAGEVPLKIVSATNHSLVLQIPSSFSTGIFDLVLFSSEGKLTFNRGLEISGESTGIVLPDPEPEVVKKTVSVGSFKGFVAVFTRGYDGSKLSVKVAGRWMLVPRINENWKGNSYSRNVRLTGAGYAIKIDIFIDGTYIGNQKLITK